MTEHKCFYDRPVHEQIKLLSSMKNEDFQKLLELLAVRKVLGIKPSCPKCLI